MNVLDQLELYRVRVEELKRTRLIRRGFNPAITIKWEKMQGLRFKPEEPDEDDLRSFLITFRQFIAKREPVFLYHIYNLCQKHLTSNKLKDFLIKSRKIWREIDTNTGMKLVYNGRQLTPEYVTDLWINGYYFHNDSEKMSILKSLLPHENMFIKHQFLSFLVEATRQVIYVGNIITVAIKEKMLKT